MERKQFIKTSLTGVFGMAGLSSFNKFTENLRQDGYLMPVLFIGHGSPMNGIENNEFTKEWYKTASEIPVPKAVLVVSAHWLTRDTRITAMDFPRTIHDFGGFPKELFDIVYPAPGNPELARETAALFKSVHAELDHDWGLDHGTWTVVRKMYPDAKIPVLQLSINYAKSPQHHYDLAKELYELRKKGVLIIGSGNMVHNLGMVAWDKIDGPAYGYDWALELNDRFKSLITDHDHRSMINYQGLGKSAALAIPSPDHYLPLIYTLGLQGSNDDVSFFNDKAVAGSLTMTSVRFG